MESKDYYQNRIIILGEPKAQKRHRSRKIGKFINQYDPDEEAKLNFLKTIQDKAPPQPLITPLEVNIVFYFTRPQAHYGTGKNAGVLKPNAPFFHTKTPDRDNLDKFVLDAMTGIFWKNDSIVCCGEIVKVYDEKPRIEIWINEITPIMETWKRNKIVGLTM